MHRRRGFSLVEIVLVISILSILIGIGIPYLRRMSSNNSLTSTSNRAKAAILEASTRARTHSGGLKNIPADRLNTFSDTFDEIRVTMPGASTTTTVMSEQVGDCTANGKLNGTDLGAISWATNTNSDLDNSQAVRVDLYYKGAFKRAIMVFDTSGAALLNLDLHMSNGFITQQLHMSRGSATISLTRSETPNTVP